VSKVFYLFSNIFRQRGAKNLKLGAVLNKIGAKILFCGAITA
jgi:hypothetical protein